jgi:protease I
MSDELTGKKIAFLVANEGVEQVELTGPWSALEAAGAETVLIAPETGQVQAFQHLDKSEKFKVDATTEATSVDDYDALVLPGGVANPDQLRQDDAAVRLVRDFVESGRPVAAICHAGWMLAEADVVDGRRLTSWPSLQTDLRNAGAVWVDDEVIIDDNLITSRKPDDLPAFCRAVVAAVARPDA